MTPQAALQKAIKHLGGPSAAARALGIKRQAISVWDRCPAARAIEVEVATDRAITRYQLRPDIYPKESK